MPLGAPCPRVVDKVPGVAYFCALASGHRVITEFAVQPGTKWCEALEFSDRARAIKSGQPLKRAYPERVPASSNSTTEKARARTAWCGLQIVDLIPLILHNQDSWPHSTTSLFLPLFSLPTSP